MNADDCGTESEEREGRQQSDLRLFGFGNVHVCCSSTLGRWPFMYQNKTKQKNGDCHIVLIITRDLILLLMCL